MILPLRRIFRLWCLTILRGKDDLTQKDFHILKDRSPSWELLTRDRAKHMQCTRSNARQCRTIFWNLCASARQSVGTYCMCRHSAGQEADCPLRYHHFNLDVRTLSYDIIVAPVLKQRSHPSSRSSSSAMEQQEPQWVQFIDIDF